MSFVEEHIKHFHQKLPTDVALVAVSKFHPIATLKEAYNSGQRIFGESRVQELTAKHAEMPTDVEWHFIGHLQTNKVRQIIPYVSLIHSVDSLRLLEIINDEATKINKTIDILLQLHVAQEETKYGFDKQECLSIFNADVLTKLPHVRVCGVMGMATNTDDDAIVRGEFKEIKAIFDQLKNDYFANADYFKIISMGMSDDHEMAIEEGSTMVRIGSTIFGAREY